jgi:hypothetical protein
VVFGNTVTFLPTALRCRTRTLFSSQDTINLFFSNEQKAVMPGLKPRHA